MAPRGGPADLALRVEGNERLLIARLIRRLRISDPPERFQALATNALRGALGVAAVAWVPGHLHEPVIVQRRGRGPARQRLPDPGPDVEPAGRSTSSTGPSAGRSGPATADGLRGRGRRQPGLDRLAGRRQPARRPAVRRPARSRCSSRVASLIATQQTNARVYADLKELLFGVIRALTAAIDAKDPYTSGHSERVARIAVRLAEELGMPANQRSDLYLMGLLHDVGKIGIDDAVLKKTGPLTPEEYREIQSHVEIGVHILTDLKKLNHLLPGVRHHHESLDGSGYPCGLAGDGDPAARPGSWRWPTAFDAMSSTRPYRRRLTPLADRRDLPQGGRRPVGPQDRRRPLRLPGRHRAHPPEGAGREPPGRRQRDPRPVVTQRSLDPSLDTRRIT